MAPEGGGGGNFLTKKFAGIPGWLILAIVGVLAYMFFRNKSGSSGTSPTSTSSTPTTGDISVGPSSPSLTINAPYSNAQTSTGTGSSSSSPTVTNPQPTPAPKAATKVNITPVKTGAITVAPYSAKGTTWDQTLAGIASHTGIDLSILKALNPHLGSGRISAGTGVNI